MATDVILGCMHHGLCLGAQLARSLTRLTQFLADLSAQGLGLFADQCDALAQEFFRFLDQCLQLAEDLILDLIGISMWQGFAGLEVVLVAE